ncbi:SagB family peptide dehydrogenase [Alicyclobacillus herbarius]|uniref:SagB family peptide dehydrogenase n=1 Tax=Alicyclobacillus herbarius TaxID=122960 RepID=UPI000428456A|nr:SagB family peptide dehydrogenase [Alicyclobacillus herbarius]
MDLNTLFYQLHYDTDKARPPEWEVDWEDAPLTFKLYRGQPVFPLPTTVPLVLTGPTSPHPLDLQTLGGLLWYVYGVSMVSQSAYPGEGGTMEVDTSLQLRRFVPSGGGLYPSELYVYLKLDELPLGVYHYNAAHHQLVLLREGHFDPFLEQALGHRCDLADCCGVAFVSTVFWKNFFKYCNFSYRLQGLDAGAVLGQLLAVAKRLSLNAVVCYQFLDRALNHLLGFSESEESVYAVVPLSTKPPLEWFHPERHAPAVTASALREELPRTCHEYTLKTRRLGSYPLLTRCNEASFLESTNDFLDPPPLTRPAEPSIDVALPQVEPMEFDLAEVSRKRYSPALDFIQKKVSSLQLAELLYETAALFRHDSDVRSPAEKGCNVSLYVCLHNVVNIPDGVYRYLSGCHGLQRIQSGDPRMSLHEALSMYTVNLFQVPVCVHVVGQRGIQRDVLGVRGYRIQQMEAGILTQCLLLAASALGMNGHPLLGFDAPTVDTLYALPAEGKTCLIQIPVGAHRPPMRLQADLRG